MPHAALALNLREATREAHHRLDHHPLLAPLLRPDLSLPAYGRALAALHGAECTYAQLLDQAIDTLAAPYRYRPRLGALEADLRSLGVEPWPWSGPPGQAPDTLAALVGMLYVLEGSSLGGQVLMRVVARTLPTAPVSFFSAADAGTRWSHFQRFAASTIRSADIDTAIDAARAVFAGYIEHLDHCLARGGNPARTRPRL